MRFIRASMDGTLILVGLTDGAVYRSVDAGRSWRLLRVGVPGGPGAQTLDMQISPSNPNVVWAAGLSGVFRSLDSGLTWSETDARSDAPGRAVGSILALDARHPEAAYLAGYRYGGLYRTGDGGLSWREVLSYPVSGLVVDPANGALIYAVSRTGGVQRSTDHGFTWAPGMHLPSYIGVGQETAASGRLLILDGPSGGLYVTMDGGGMQRSTDGGRTWQDLSPGLPQNGAGAGYAVPYGLTFEGGLQPRLYVVMPPPLTDSGAGGTLFGLSLPSTTAITSTGALTPTVAPMWQPVARGVDALVHMPGTAPLLATEAALGSGATATIGRLGYTPLLQVPYLLPPPLARISGDGFAFGSTQLSYLSGINYEGPNDRPWQLWQDGKFDDSLVAQDLDAASAAGYRLLRVFVQDPLPAQVLAGEFGHLDTLVTLARQRELHLLITFNDSRDPDLTRVAAVDRAIASHLAGNPTIFGYDLQNEPGFQDIMAAIYPAGSGIPLQSATLIRHYGARVSLTKIRADRVAGKWRDAPFDHMTADQVWVYLNVASIVDDFFTANPDYPSTPVAADWMPMAQALNQSLATYIQVQMQAVRGVDRQHLITVGYNSLVWSSLPANEALDFRSIHLYPTTQSFASIHDSLRSFENLRGAARSPLVLGEYGFSTAFQSGSTASVQETAMSLYLRVLGGEGDFKWVLNDDTVGYNPYENGLGLFGAHGAAKAGFFVDREMAAYFSGPHQPGGVRMWADPTTGIGYLYAAPDALGVSGASYSDTRLSYTAHNSAPSAQLWLDWTQPGHVRLVSTHEADLHLDLAALVGAQPGPVALSPAQTVAVQGLQVRLHLQPGIWYTITFTPGAIPAMAPQLPVPALASGWYILAAGHNVAPPFLRLWLRLGGVSLAGQPLAEAQITAQGSVQYYTSIAIQARQGVAHLLPLGLTALGGQTLPAAKELSKKVRHQYFAATGHNLSGVFLRFWKATGGVAVWGPPVGEQQVHNGLTVQYLANAEFVYDGSSVSLAPLGAQAWARLSH